MNDRQREFCRQYLVDLNATQAAIRAGYSTKTANEQGSQLLAKLSIQEEIQKLIKERSQRTEVTADKVVKELAKLGFSNIADFVEFGPAGVNMRDWETLAEQDMACVAEVSQVDTKEGTNVKFKLHDKKSALELLGKHLGLFLDRYEQTGTLNVAGQVDVEYGKKTIEELYALLQRLKQAGKR